MSDQRQDNPRMNWESKDLNAAFKRFKEHADFMFKGPLSATSEEVKCNYLMLWVGDKGRHIYRTWKIDAGDKKLLEMYYKKFEEHCKLMSNMIYNRYLFKSRVQQESETFEQFVTELKILVKDCGYPDDFQDEQIRDHIVFGVRSSKIRQDMLLEGSDLTSDKCMDIAHTYELSAPQAHSIGNQSSSSAAVDSLSYQNQGRGHGRQRHCHYCGNKVHKNKTECPAYGKQCHKCSKYNHFDKLCKSVHEVTSERSVYGSDCYDEDTLNSFFVNTADSEMDMDKIIDHIYLGSAFAAQDTDSLTRLGITHVLTIDTQPLKYDLSENITYKYIYCVDMAEADLLTKFDECFKFIDDGLSQESGAVLIHCLAGVSRSATVLTAYLMYRHNMCLDEALGTIKEHRPRIKPNPGFMRQLEIFEEMGSIVDPGNEVWRKYKLGRMADRMQAGSIEEFPSEDLLANPHEALNKTDSYFKCRKCRQPLFRSSGIMTHTVGQGEAAFDWRSKIHGSKSVEESNDRLCTQSLFIEPVRWMAETINQLDGKILCPKCHAKLGSFIWYGEKCPCGAWVAPAFHIQRSKVDEVMTSQLPANQAQPKSQVTGGRQDLSDSGVAPACSSETLAEKHDSSNAILCAVNGKTNGGKDTILEEILHPRRVEDIS